MVKLVVETAMIGVIVVLDLFPHGLRLRQNVFRKRLSRCLDDDPNS